MDHKEGRSQRLKREEAIERNQDKKAMAADIRYLLHNFGGQKDPPLAESRISTTPADEQAAASVRVDKTCHEKMAFSCYDYLFISTHNLITKRSLGVGILCECSCWASLWAQNSVIERPWGVGQPFPIIRGLKCTILFFIQTNNNCILLAYIACEPYS